MTSVALTPSRSVADTGEFTGEQKEYLQGFLAGVAARGLAPQVGHTGDGQITATPEPGQENLAAPAKWHDHDVADLVKQELWKMQEHGLDGWDRLLAHADANRLPDDEHTFRFRFYGLFYVGPNQESFMLRCRIPAGELTAVQLRGLADIAEQYGNGRAAITTRANLQIREIAPKHLVQVITRLQGLGLTSKGAGVDNVRNITASPTAGIDPQEYIDTRPFAHALHHYILNNRDLFDLPRKFNVAFEGGGAIDTAADTNDLGFVAVKIEPTSAGPITGTSLKDGTAIPLDAGVYFRVELAGITGHKQFARDAGLVLRPGEAVAVAAAMVRVFAAHGDRTDRKKARLKYLMDKWGAEKFLAETQKLLAFPLVQLPLDRCILRHPSIRHGHIGVYRQSQPAKNFLGAVVPVGIMSAKQMRRVADLAANYGAGQIRLTPWQNLLVTDVPDAFVDTVQRNLARIGLPAESTNLLGGLVACTGNQGCKYANADTKGNAVALGEYLNRRLQLDQPINLHLTGCANSCAQHYMGDIGLQAVRVPRGDGSVEGYHIALGGGSGHQQGVARQVFSNIPFTEVPALLEHVLRVYLARRQPGEAFVAFTRRHELKQLQEMFTPTGA